MKRLVTFQRFSAPTAKSGFGTPVVDEAAWRDLAEELAERRDLSDAEKVAAGMPFSVRAARFVVLWNSRTSTLTSEDRMIGDGLTWDILGVKEADDRRRKIEVTAHARRS